jgi:acetyl esterase/lipase
VAWPILIAAAVAVSAAETAPVEIPLWPNGAPGFEARRHEPVQAQDWWMRNVHNPTLTAYLPPKEKVFLSEHGIAAFVLKYRLFREEGSVYTLETHVRQDVERAMRLVRSRVTEWGVDAKRLGILGFSAGGEVVALVAYGDGNGAPQAPDPIDRLNARPDFQMLVYPGPLGVPEKVAADAPPLFMVVANDDECCSPPVVSLLQRYRAAGASVEAHLYAQGNHAFNMGTRSKVVSIQTWPQRPLDWMADSGFLVRP